MHATLFELSAYHAALLSYLHRTSNADVFSALREIEKRNEMLKKLKVTLFKIGL